MEAERQRTKAAVAEAQRMADVQISAARSELERRVAEATSKALAEGEARVNQVHCHSPPWVMICDLIDDLDLLQAQEAAKRQIATAKEDAASQVRACKLYASYQHIRRACLCIQRMFFVLKARRAMGAVEAARDDIVAEARRNASVSEYAHLKM